MKYVPVQAVSVFLWGRRVGVLAHAYDAYSQFEYDPDFRRTGLEIAPLAMPQAMEMPCPSEPVEASTPGVRFMLGWP